MNEIMIVGRLAEAALRTEGGSHSSFRMNLQERGQGQKHVALRQKSTTVFFSNVQIINGVSSSQLRKGTASLLIMFRGTLLVIWKNIEHCLLCEHAITISDQSDPEEMVEGLSNVPSLHICASSSSC